MAKKVTDVWKLETLVKKAFDRTKQRFLSYIFVYVIGIGIMILAAIALLLLGGIIFLIFRATNLPVLTILLGVAVGVGFIGVLIYLGAWIQLSILSVMTDDKRVSVNESLKKTKPLVPGFIVLAILNGLFIAGLLPFGFLTLFIVFILWWIWGSMVGFVYLHQKQPKGITSLWISRQMVNQNFWGIVGRMLLIGGGLYFITFIFSSSKNALLSALVPIISILIGPFIISFLYEMYKNLSVPKAVEKPKVWVTLSVIGWVISLVVFVSLGAFLASLLQNLPIPR